MKAGESQKFNNSPTFSKKDIEVVAQYFRLLIEIERDQELKDRSHDFSSDK
jgi:hypothetical protein